jgi:hypothetical protein
LIETLLAWRNSSVGIAARCHRLTEIPIVALVSIIDTWWMVALGALYMLCATGVLLAVILKELDRDEGSQPR